MKKVRNGGCRNHIRYYETRLPIKNSYHDQLYFDSVEECRLKCPYCKRVLLMTVRKEDCICPTCGYKVRNTSKGRFKWMLKKHMKSNSG